MGLLRRLFEKRSGNPSQHSLAAIFGMQSNTYAGVPVTEDTALTYSAVYAAIRLLSWSAAMLPLLTYRRQARGKVRAADHPLYTLLKEQTNPEMTAFDFRSTIMSHAVGRGNGYAEIEWSNAGQPLALWPLNPARMTPERVGGQLRYLYDLPDGTTANLPSWRVHHIKGLSSNGVIGLSPIRLAMQAIGLGMATEEFGSRFFGNGARPGVIIRHPGVLSDNAFKRLKESWSADHQGLSQSHRMRILEEGMDIETVGVPPEEAQFLETRQFQVTEIARWFSVPPHMIADMSGATFSNIEEQGVGFVTYSLGPWLTNVEQALARDLLMPGEKSTILIEHLVDGLLRGRTSERYAAYQSALQGGWMSPNEVRERENLNPYDGGDTYLLPLNMAPAAQAGQRSTRAEGSTHSVHCMCAHCRAATHEPECECPTCRSVSRETAGDAAAERRAQDLGDERRKIMRAYVPLFADVAKRMVRREVADIRRELQKQLRRRAASAAAGEQRNLDEFERWLDQFYSDFRVTLGQAFLPVMISLAEQMTGMVVDELNLDDQVVQLDLRNFIDAYLEQFAALTAIGSQKQLEALIEDATEAGDDALGAIEERLAEWEVTKPDKIAEQQSHEAGNALIVECYSVSGVRYLRWQTNSGACPFCRKFNGKVVGISEYFAEGGSSILGDDEDEPMLVRRNTRHPPIHGGCTCTITAG